jgi:hypothetical protein
MILLPAVQAVEIRNAVYAQQYGLAVDHEIAVSVRSAASVIRGKRSLRSWPLRANSRTRLPWR